MKPEYTIKCKSLTESQALIKSLLTESYIVGFNQVGLTYSVEIYGKRDEQPQFDLTKFDPSIKITSGDPIKDDPIEQIKKKIQDAINDGMKPQPYKKKFPWDKDNPFGSTIYYYGDGESLLDQLKKSFDEE